MSDDRTRPPELDTVAASAEVLMEVWDNEYDAIYDNWRELYGLTDGPAVNTKPQDRPSTSTQ